MDGRHKLRGYEESNEHENSLNYTGAHAWPVAQALPFGVSYREKSKGMWMGGSKERADAQFSICVSAICFSCSNKHILRKKKSPGTRLTHTPGCANSVSFPSHCIKVKV